MPNICICGHHYASHEGYDAKAAEGGGACRATRPFQCDCVAFVHDDGRLSGELGRYTDPSGHRWDSEETLLRPDLPPDTIITGQGSPELKELNDRCAENDERLRIARGAK